MVIDLSADFRFNDISLHNSYYDIHKNPDYIKKFCYGLPELFKDNIRKIGLYLVQDVIQRHRLLIPLLKDNLIEGKEIIIDSKSGITGAGRNVKEELLFSENF